MFLKQVAESPLVHMLDFDDKYKQLISNGPHVLYLNFFPIMIGGTTIELKILKTRVRNATI